ncbi:MAG: hypothetical protein ACI9MR_003493, partial [Myxococcota bacterium]
MRSFRWGTALTVAIVLAGCGTTTSTVTISKSDTIGPTDSRSQPLLALARSVGLGVRLDEARAFVDHLPGGRGWPPLFMDEPPFEGRGFRGWGAVHGPNRVITSLSIESVEGLDALRRLAKSPDTKSIVVGLRREAVIEQFGSPSLAA